MSRFFLKDILQEYITVQQRELAALNRRRKKILKEIPEIGLIHERIIELMAERSKEIILNQIDSRDDMDNLQKKIADLKAQETELLMAKGYPKDYLQLHHHCAKCKDTGYIGYPVREKCGCLIQRLLERTYDLSNIHELDTENFSTFNPRVFPETPPEKGSMNQREYMVWLKSQLLHYVSLFPKNDKKTMLFTGKTGLGKTFLLNCMAKAIMDNGYSVIRISAYKLFDQLFYSAISDKDEYDSMQKRLFQVDALIIDDLGTETRRNNYTTEDLFNLINERSIQQSHTFLSTNLGLSLLRERYSDRITSRLFDRSNTMIVRFWGEDVRLYRTLAEAKKGQ